MKKKLIKKRSVQDRAKFFKKNFHKAGLGSAGTKKEIIQKSDANPHDLIEEAIEKESGIPVVEEEVVETQAKAVVENDLDDDLDDDLEDDLEDADDDWDDEEEDDEDDWDDDDDEEDDEDFDLDL